jgi:hypothetical protein
VKETEVYVIVTQEDSGIRAERYRTREEADEALAEEPNKQILIRARGTELEVVIEDHT